MSSGIVSRGPRRGGISAGTDRRPAGVTARSPRRGWVPVHACRRRPQPQVDFRWVDVRRPDRACGRGRSRRTEGADRPIGGRADLSPRRIRSPPANVGAVGVPAGPQPDFGSGVLFVGGDTRGCVSLLTAGVEERPADGPLQVHRDRRISRAARQPRPASPRPAAGTGDRGRPAAGSGLRGSRVDEHDGNIEVVVGNWAGRPRRPPPGFDWAVRRRPPPPLADQYWRGRRSDEKSTTPRSQASASPQPSSASVYASSTPGTRRSNGPSVSVRSVP